MGSPAPEEYVAILAPLGQDAALLSQSLRRAGIAPRCLPDMAEFCAALPDGAAGLLTAEALDALTLRQLEDTLAAQSPWSDLPLVLLTNRLDSASYALLARSLGNVTIVERPLDEASLLTLVRTALRARRRQYQMRDLLLASQAQAAQIHDLNERLRRSMTETHHRVKNSLQLICAFVDLQIDEYSDQIPASALRSINAQVRALAAIHDVLTEETRTHIEANFVSARTLLGKLFPMIGSIAHARELHYEIEDVRLPSRQGSSLALVANELVLNALKHSGHNVDVTLGVRDHTATLRVCDDGPGLPPGFDVRLASHTGLALVENLARWDLRGETAYANRSVGHGAQIEVSFPLAQEE